MPVIVHGTYQPYLVVLSIMIGIIASFTALDLAGRVADASPRGRLLWRISAAICFSGGIWGMHFVAMLAYRLPGICLGYSVFPTVWSLLIAVFVTFVGFVIVTDNAKSMVRLLIGGGIMGFGITAMHYTGMEAMILHGNLRFGLSWMILAFSIASSASVAGLYLANTTGAMDLLWRRIAASLALGLAIVAMHYLAMEGTEITVVDPLPIDYGYRWISEPALGIIVAFFSMLILCMGLGASFVDRRLARKAGIEREKLHQSEEHARLLYQHTPLPLYALDRDGRIQNVTQHWLDLMEYSVEEVVGHRLGHFLVPESATRAAEIDWPDIVRTGVKKDMEYRAITKGGKVIDIIASGQMMRNEQGEPSYFLCGMTDVTERKRTEDALRQAQKVEAIGHLTGGVAHDFNNLLAVVMGSLEMMGRRLPDDPILRRYADQAMQGAERGKVLTQRLLAFARKQQLTPEAVNVAELVNGMADLMRRSLGPMVRIEMQFPSTIGRARVDSNQLELVLLNLAVNARDAMPHGGTLTISSRMEVVSSDQRGVLPRGRYVCLSVADTGVGMDQDTLARAMEPFFTTKPAGKGTGLGLSMAQGLAAQSGGRLFLNSRLGEGTTVEIWLPSVDTYETPRAQENTPRIRAHSKRALKILVVDDDPLVLNNTAAMLADVDHILTQCHSGYEALALFESGATFDAVVTDMAMPGMSGSQLASKLHAFLPKLPILLISGYADLPFGEITDLPRLSKPFTQNALVSEIEKIVGELVES